MRWRKGYTILLIIVMLIVGLGSYLGNYILPYGIVVPLRKHPQDVPHRFPQGYHPKDMGIRYDSLTVYVEDTLALQGFWLQAEDSSRGAIILLHGISSFKEAMLDWGKWLTENQWDAVLMDLRAHGTSDGTFNTYGYREKADVSAVVDYLHQRDSSLQVGMLGNSLGGAIAYQSLAHDDRLAFGIVFSTFSHLPQIIQDYQQQLSFGLHFPETTTKAIQKAAVIADFPAFEIHPAMAATQVSQPMLVIHGLADENIKPAYGRENFDSLASRHKYWIPVEGADHYNVSAVGGTALKDTVAWFLKRL